VAVGDSDAVIAAYISGHGYGHAVRTAQVLRAIRAARPDVPLAMVTSTPEEVCRRLAGEPLLYRGVRLDVGVIQKDALTQDEHGTAEAWEALHRDYDRRVAVDARWLRESGTRMVVADVPPIAFDAAAAAGLPAIAVTNFSWDWIYRHLTRHDPRLQAAADQAARAYAHARLLLELPFAGDLSAFPRREPIPLVARAPRHSLEEARRALGLDPEATVVLVTFGGIGMPGFDLGVLASMADVTFVVTEGTGAPANVRRLDVEALAPRGLEYADAVTAADAVLTKPGYGIVSDAIACRTRMIYTERGDFPEYPILVNAMARWVPAVHVSNEDVRSGRLRTALDEVTAASFPDPPRMDGAEVAARRILQEAGV